MKRWLCTVCGYIHEGETPPDTCPRCGAPKEKFVLMQDQDESMKTAQEAQVKADAVQTESVPKSEASSSSENVVDVIVVGSGAAAFSAAITAVNEGCSVIMLEKALQIGGTTIRSGGGFWTPNNKFQRARGVKEDRVQTMKYMARYSFPHLYRPELENFGLPENEYQLIEAMVDHAAEMTEYFEGIGAFELCEEINWAGKPQVDYQDHLPENGSVRGRCLYTKDTNGKIGYGYVLVSYLKAWAEKNHIPILVDHEVKRIRRDTSGKVVGVEALHEGKTIVFTASKGVIFGSGGFSHNPELLLHFEKGPIFGTCSAPTNTGDFISLAGEIGAKIGNMGGAFRAQSVFEIALANQMGIYNVFFVPGDSVLEVNKFGKRVMDEKRNYSDRGMVHFVWDPNRAEWTNMLLFLVYDSRTADLWQGYPPYPEGATDAPYIIKVDKLEDFGNAIAERLSQLADHTGGFSLDEQFNANLVDTVAKFNQYAASGKDEDFQRGDFAYDREWTTFPPTKPGAGAWPADMDKNYTMHPLDDAGPYYCIILSSGTLDTNGGPVINKHSQVLDVHGEIIEGLYGAGNCIASPTANAYWGAGSTIGPALTFGYIAGRHVSGHPV